MRLVELLPRYYAANTRLRRVETRQHYERSIRQFGEYLGHDPTLADLTDDNATGFMLSTLDAGLTAVTSNQRVKQIRALWEWAARRKYVDTFPTYLPLDEPDTQPIGYTPAQVMQLFAACSQQTGYIGPFPAALWWRSQHWWYWSTAERTEATLSLERSHVDLDAAIARVPAKIRKGGRKAMTYRLPPQLVELFGEMFKYPIQSPLVWERDFGIAAYYHRYRRLVEAAGLPTPRGKCGPKKLRITVLSMVRGLGGNATEFAKHSSSAVTDESYIDEAIVMCMTKGVWPPKNIDPEKSRNWLLRLFGRAG
jgi:integrase